MVAMFGPIIAAPLAKPVSRTSPPSTVQRAERDLWPRVGRQDGVRDVAEAPGVAASISAAISMPASIVVHRQLPADDAGRATSICSVVAADLAGGDRGHRRASASPCSPVQALALPEQMTTPRASSAGSRSRQT